jgi:hypothetical protein
MSCCSTSTLQYNTDEVRFLTRYLCNVSQIVSLGATGSCSEFVTALSVCLQEYLVRVRTQARHRSLIAAYHLKALLLNPAVAIRTANLNLFITCVMANR